MADKMLFFGLFRFSLLISFAAIFLPCVRGAIEPIVVKGNRFFTQNSGTQFFIKGLHYRNVTRVGPSLTLDDLLADPLSCSRDATNLQKLGINLITIDQLNPVRNHTECMNTLADAGVYVQMLLHNDNLLEYNDTRWPEALYDNYTSIVDALAPYDNTFGFYFGLVPGERFSGDAYPMLKAGVRDLKAHMKEKSYRDIPIGYEQVFNVQPSGVALDMDKLFPEAEFLTCGGAKVDFMAAVYPKFMNRYNGCEKEVFDETDMFEKMAESAGYPPVFISKYGCLINATDDSKDKRNFTVVEALYNDTQVDSVQGGVAMEYFKDGQVETGGLLSSQYGLFSMDLQKGSMTTAPGYTPFSSLLAKATPSAMKANEYNPSTTVRSCSKSWSSWAVAPTLPPTPKRTVCDCMMAQQRCILKDGKADSIKANLSFVEQQEMVTNLCDNDAKASCPGIYRDASSGTYGAFSFCADEEVWTYAASEKWKRDGKGCDYNGRFELRDLPPAAGNSAECDIILKQVGDDGKGTITSFPATSTQTSTGQPQTGGGSSLSTGAKAGIGVAIAILVLIAISAILIFLRRRRKLRAVPEIHEEDNHSIPTAPYREMEADPFKKSELDGRPIPMTNYERSELPVDVDVPVELDGEEIPVEAHDTSHIATAVRAAI